MNPVAILGCGMVTGVGLTAKATNAAVRAAITGFDETRFMGPGGDWVIGCQVPLAEPHRGLVRLVQLLVPAVRECLLRVPTVPCEKIVVLLCVAEAERPGRTAGLDDGLFAEFQAAIGATFHPQSRTLSGGRVGGITAMAEARRLIHDERVSHCVIAGVDSYLLPKTLNAYADHGRLLTESNSNGFIPGEAGAAVVVGPPDPAAAAELRCGAVGFGHEKVTVYSEDPFRADGLVEAYHALPRDGDLTLDDADYRITDCSGEQYGFKNDRLAYARTVRKLKERFDHQHPADCIGEVGAAIVPIMLGLAWTAARKGYAPGDGVLCHCSNDHGERGAMILRNVRKEHAL